MSFNNTYFPAANSSIQFEEFVVKTIDQINTYTTNSFFDDQAILKEIKVQTTLNEKQFFSKSNQITLSNSVSGNSEKFIIRFTGEGIIFKIVFEKNNDWKDGYLALEFNIDNHSLLKAIEKTVAGFLVANPQPKVEVLKKVNSTELQETLAVAGAVALEPVVNFDEPCKCNSITPFSSGASAMQISDFTPDFVSYYSYKNLDELTVFICKKCDTNWLIDARFTDKSTYVNAAKKISAEKSEKIKKQRGTSLDNLIEKSGVQAIVDLV